MKRLCPRQASIQTISNKKSDPDGCKNQFLRKVHARAFCDESSDCARLKDKPRLEGVLDGQEGSKGNHDALLIKLHSDEEKGNLLSETLESPTSEKPKYW